eukprot:CAMPEP_0114166966 /NCGR_PEP_ID=MMETSP0043_2-20121206/32126_1 /TAXON_ID=464988 /ORGANISM="Hemiselmis andersenii, Strain CCMP644" /LENGTH=70 /DNA_ID=CAMNT_0001264015 /DNA_START=415 /DNA_END=627 /DNA_ORIENTATION=+
MARKLARDDARPKAVAQYVLQKMVLHTVNVYTEVVNAKVIPYLRPLKRPFDDATEIRFCKKSPLDFWGRE